VSTPSCAGAAGCGSGAGDIPGGVKLPGRGTDREGTGLRGIGIACGDCVVSVGWIVIPGCIEAEAFPSSGAFDCCESTFLFVPLKMLTLKLVPSIAQGVGPTCRESYGLDAPIYKRKGCLSAPVMVKFRGYICSRNG
jgi:hypothetical protein